MTNSSIPPTMRAWSYKGRGQLADVLNLTSDFTTPSPSNLGPNDVLVKIEYTAFTPSASALISILPNWIHTLPAVPELVLSGTVAALGSNVAAKRPDLTIGARVFGGTSTQLYFKGHGALAEYCPCPEEQLVVIPSSISFRDAAALGGNGVTAVEVLEELGLKKGEKILINGGSGATGTMLVQCARAIVGDSGRVVATCSEGNSEMVKRIGADETIDYRKHDPLHEYLAKEHSETRFDAIADTVGIQDLYTHSPKYLRENGRFVNIGAMHIQSGLQGLFGYIWSLCVNLLWPKILGGTPRWYKMVTATPNQFTLSRSGELAEKGHLTAMIDSEWEMEDVLEAYKKLHSQRAKGTILARIPR
ncbi:hypothetical protein N7509_004115 [Penicillium cosmopolitanum]|uniref:Enoyl reductase (ER) domain-containing protein n=1 Tax=Penicillium cosmopolitanum TaxID=1131564 RepID=A0A9W9W674_9EURO|nr:uncharacterized protein N7509_004115 [Penicillium cosmopolitanum]KAJ5404244.1 hypothetical protein N7509_004115 [Penicillium cosmopolitanum]